MERQSSRWVLLLLLLATLHGVALAEVLPKPGSRDARVRIATFDPDEIYLLQAFVGYQIEIEFEAGERILGQGGGDLDDLRRNSLAHDQCASGCYGEADYRKALMGKTDSDQTAKTISDEPGPGARPQRAWHGHRVRGP